MSHPQKPIKPTKIDIEKTFKGCIHWYEFKRDIKAKTIDDIHPCIIIGKDNPKSHRVIISPISDASNYTEKNENGELEVKYSYHVLLKKSQYTFLEKDSVILLDQVFTIPRSYLCEEWYMGKIDEVRKIDEAIMENYDLIQTVTELLHEMVDRIANVKSTSNF